ncbi:hypothetical protein B0H14DRAFT_3862675 [Mycena olivaceomarginata]|nr:hypothetical protein B0H14DRAFT_3862675 [Mycena olivaceomarginata]
MAVWYLHDGDPNPGRNMDEIWLMTVPMPRWGTDDEWRQIRKRHRAPPLDGVTTAVPDTTMSEYLLYTAPVLAGTQANWALLATLSIQVYTFHIRFPNDRRWIKILAKYSPPLSTVCTVFLLELAQTGTSSHYAYWVLALGWGNTAVLDKIPWSCLATPVFIGITAALVQIFFSWRIYVLMGKTLWACVVTSVIVLLALAQGVTIFIVMAQVTRAMTLTSVTKITVGVKVWLILVAVCDVLITATLIIIMSWEERRSGTDTFMVKLMLNTAETGAVTSATALIYLALFLVYPQHNPDQTTSFIFGKLQVSPLPPASSFMSLMFLHVFSDTLTSSSSL